MSRRLKPKCGLCKTRYGENECCVCYVCGDTQHQCIDDVASMIASLNTYDRLKFICDKCERDPPAKQSAIDGLVERMMNFEESIKQLLSEGMQPQRSTANKSKPTYSQIVTVRPIESQNGDQIENAKEKVLKKIDPQALQASGIRTTINGGVKFNVGANQGKSELENEIKSQLGDNFVITVSNEKKPKVKIVGFDDLHMNEEEIEEAMRQQNSSLFGEEEHLKVVKEEHHRGSGPTQIPAAYENRSCEH